MNNKEKIIKNHELRLLRKIHELDYYAGRENTGNYQPVIGFYAGYLNSGDRYTATGYYAGYLNTGSHQTTRSYQTTTGYYEGKPQRVLMRAIKTQGVTKSQPVF